MKRSKSNTLRFDARRASVRLLGVLFLMPLIARAAVPVITYTDLNPAGAVQSSAYGVTANQQAGMAYFGIEHAAIWAGTPSSFVDLNPASAAYSILRATAGNQ